MFRAIGAAFGGRRVLVLSLITMVTAVSFTTDTADARRRYRHNRHHARIAYNPPFSAIIVDANTGGVLHANNAQALRHPASLTKIMTLYMLFEVDGKPVVVFADRASADGGQRAAPDGLNLYSRMLDGLVLYELTPLDGPRAMELFQVASYSESELQAAGTPW